MMLGDTRIVQAENAVFQRRRSDVQFDDSWASYTNAAQVVLGYFQDTEIVDLEMFFDPKTVVTLLAAARILDGSCASILSRTHTEEETDTALGYAQLAAASYGICGNFPAARAVIRRLEPLMEHLSAFDIACLCCSAPGLIGKFLPLSGDQGPAREFLEQLEAFFRTGEDEKQSAARESFLALRNTADSAFALALWMSFYVSLEQCFVLSTARMFRHSGKLGALSLALARDGIRTFLPPQYVALNDHQILSNKQNAILSLPTSTGKTLLSELFIYDAVSAAGRIGVFVVPYVALGRQVADRVSKHLGKSWKILRLFGGYKEPGGLEESLSKLFVVATPERVDALLRFDPNLIARLDCIVFDEAHMIENGARGARVECLLARLLLRQSTGHRFRIILASAVAPNIQQLATWIDAPARNIVKHNWTPSGKRIAMWKESGELTWYYSNDSIAPVGTRADQPIFTVNLPWPRRIFARSGSYQENIALEPANLENIAYICHYFWQKFREPILCVCATKDTTRKIAHVLSQRIEPHYPLPDGIQAAIDIIASRYPHFTHLRSSLERGIAYHNASIPHDLRGAIERAARRKELSIVLSTTTLAEGVDLPFRVTILADWLGFRAKGQVPLSPLLVRNIAGRCGRAGYFTEGDVIVYDNPLGPREYKRGDLKAAHQRRVLFSEGDQGITSAAANDIAEPEIHATVESQFLAAVSENPDDTDIEIDFVANMFAKCVNQGASIDDVVHSASAMLTDANWQLATRQSPLKLTPLGESVNKTGFSPRTCKRILDYLSAPEMAVDDISVGTGILLELGDVPEQSDRKFGALLTRYKQKQAGLPVSRGAPKTMVRVEHIRDILSRWLEGEQPIDIFSKLPTVLNSSRAIGVDEWRRGTSELTTWDTEFEKFCEFLQATVFEFLPWVLRGCALLSSHLPGEPFAGMINWNEMAEKYHRDSSVTQREDTQEETPPLPA